MAKILFLINTFKVGGAERQAILLAGQLKYAGHVTLVCAFQKGGEQAATLCSSLGLSMRVLPLPLSKPRPARSMIAFLYHLRRFSPDYIFSYCSTPNIFAALAFPFTSARHCIWGQRDAGLDASLLKMFPYLNRIPSVFVSNSLAGMDFLKVFAPNALAFHIQNAISLSPPQKTRSQWRQRLDVDSHALLFLMIATLSSHKAHDILLEAWALARKDPLFPSSARLVLAGRPDDQAENLHQMATDLGIKDSVNFAGNVEDVAGLIAAADIGVFSSRLEGLPNSVLECMAGGLPLVALDIAGTREAMGDIKGNILVLPHTAAGFAHGLVGMAIDSDRRHVVGVSNKNIIENCYSPARLLEKYEEILNLPPASARVKFINCFFSLYSIAYFLVNKLVRKVLRMIAMRNKEFPI